MPTETEYAAQLRSRAIPGRRQLPNPAASSLPPTPTGRSRTLPLPLGGAQVRYPSPLAREVTVGGVSSSGESDDDDTDSEEWDDESIGRGSLADRRPLSPELGDEVASLTLESQFSQFDLSTEGGSSTSDIIRPPASDAETIDSILVSDLPIVSVMVVDNHIAVRMYKACKRDRRRLRVKFLTGGKALVIYSLSIDTYHEVANYAKIRAVSATERCISKLAASLQQALRAFLPLITASQFWATVVSAAFISTCIVIASLCLAFDACLDVVAAPEKVIKLIANLGLVILGCLIYGTRLLGQSAFATGEAVVRFVVVNTVLLNARTQQGVQTLIRTSINFLEAFLRDDL